MLADQVSALSAIRRRAHRAGEHVEIDVVNARKRPDSAGRGIRFHAAAEELSKLRRQQIHAVLIVAEFRQLLQFQAKRLIALKVHAQRMDQLGHGAQLLFEHALPDRMQAVRQRGNRAGEHLIVLDLPAVPDRVRARIQRMLVQAGGDRRRAVLVRLLVVPDMLGHLIHIAVDLIAILIQECLIDLLERGHLCEVAAVMPERQAGLIDFGSSEIGPFVVGPEGRARILLAPEQRKLQRFYRFHLPEPDRAVRIKRDLRAAVVGIDPRHLQRNAPVHKGGDDVVVVIGDALPLAHSDHPDGGIEELRFAVRMNADIDMRLRFRHAHRRLHDQIGQIAGDVLAVFIHAADHEVHQRVAAVGLVQPLPELAKDTERLIPADPGGNVPLVQLAQMHIHAPDTGRIGAPQAPDEPEQLHALLKRIRRMAGKRSAIQGNPVQARSVLRPLKRKRFGFFCMAQDVFADRPPAVRDQRAVFLLRLTQSVAGRARPPDDPGNAFLHQELIVQREMRIIPTVILLSPYPRFNHGSDRIDRPCKETRFGDKYFSPLYILQNTASYFLY